MYPHKVQVRCQNRIEPTRGRRRRANAPAKLSFLVCVEEDPDRPLLVEGERRLTRGMAWDQARRLATFFLSRGLKPGDVISFQLPNWVEAAVVALAARMCGLIINPVTPIYREAELSYILADCGSKLIFVPQLFRKWDHLRQVRTLNNLNEAQQKALSSLDPAGFPASDKVMSRCISTAIGLLWTDEQIKEKGEKIVAAIRKVARQEKSLA